MVVVAPPAIHWVGPRAPLKRLPQRNEQTRFRLLQLAKRTSTEPQIKRAFQQRVVIQDARGQVVAGSVVKSGFCAPYIKSLAWLQQRVDLMSNRPRADEGRATVIGILGRAP